jgi:energy-coupling factor transporter ATP-binding protein EcfA2
MTVIAVTDLALPFGTRILYKDVNLRFTPASRYDAIGADGSGRSTFLDVLSGKLEPDWGTAPVGAGERVAVLRRSLRGWACPRGISGRERIGRRCRWRGESPRGSCPNRDRRSVSIASAGVVAPLDRLPVCDAPRCGDRTVRDAAEREDRVSERRVLCGLLACAVLFGACASMP